MISRLFVAVGLVAMMLLEMSDGFFVSSRSATTKTIAMIRADEMPPTWPRSVSQGTQESVVRSARSIAAMLGGMMVVPSLARSEMVEVSESVLRGLFSDPVYRFAVIIPPSWTVIPRKSSAVTLARYLPEELLLTASSFAEGASMSVTRSNAQRLLQDFDIDYWFAPLNAITDVGTADLVARLLILQRQGEFEKRETPSVVSSAVYSRDNKELLFDFLTPLAKGVNRRTISKVYFRRGNLYTAWISGLESVFEGDYSKTLFAVRESFILTAAPEAEEANNTSAR